MGLGGEVGGVGRGNMKKRTLRTAVLKGNYGYKGCSGGNICSEGDRG